MAAEEPAAAPALVAEPEPAAPAAIVAAPAAPAAPAERLAAMKAKAAAAEAERKAQAEAQAGGCLVVASCMAWQTAATGLPQCCMTWQGCCC